MTIKVKYGVFQLTTKHVLPQQKGLIMIAPNRPQRVDNKGYIYLVVELTTNHFLSQPKGLVMHPTDPPAHKELTIEVKYGVFKLTTNQS